MLVINSMETNLESVFGKDVDEGEEEEESKQKGKKLSPPQINFEKMVDKFYSTNPFNYATNQTAELEVRFGTRGIQKLTKNDYDITYVYETYPIKDNISNLIDDRIEQKRLKRNIEKLQAFEYLRDGGSTYFLISHLFNESIP